MNARVTGGLRALVCARSVAALGTLQAGDPYVSMVPYAVSADGRAIIVHVSRLAAHTRNMQQESCVSVLIMESEGPDKLPQSLARVTIQGRARSVTPDAPEYEGAREAYLSRFADAAELFEFADFGLFLLEVRSARYVGGFAQAVTLTPDAFARAITGSEAQGV